MIDIQVGDRVVCVDAGPSKNGRPSGLKERALYFVKEVCGGLPGHPDECDIFLVLEGFVPPPGKTGLHLARRFRKVAPKSASQHIEALKKLPALKENVDA